MVEDVTIGGTRVITASGQIFGCDSSTSSRLRVGDVGECFINLLGREPWRRDGSG